MTFAGAELRARAMVAVGTLRDARLESKLTELLLGGDTVHLSDSDPVSVAAAWALARLGTKSSLVPLEKLAASDSGNLRAPISAIDDLDFDRAFRTGGHTCRCLPLRQPAVAHVALPDHSALGVVLRHAVGAVPRAVLAADAGVRTVPHNSGYRILRIRIDRTPCEAGRFEAVIASHRDERA